jgi:hypothetical protein
VCEDENEDKGHTLVGECHVGVEESNNGPGVDESLDASGLSLPEDIGGPLNGALQFFEMSILASERCVLDDREAHVQNLLYVADAGQGRRGVYDSVDALQREGARRNIGYVDDLKLVAKTGQFLLQLVDLNATCGAASYASTAST